MLIFGRALRPATWSCVLLVASLLPATQVLAQDAARGGQLFEEVGCSSCHGANAMGDFGPRLANTELLLDAVRSQVRNPSGRMMSFSAERLSDDDIADIYAWLQTFDDEPYFPTWFGTDLINMPTPLMPGKKTLEVHFSHRFTTSIRDAGREELWGLDSFAIPVFWFAYGITDWLQVQGGRSSINATWDYGAKVELLGEDDTSVPIAASVVVSGAFLDRDDALNTKRFALEAPVGWRAHERLSLMVVPFWATNTDDLDLPESPGYSTAVGVGGSVRLTPGQSIDVEWITNLGGYQRPDAVDLWQVFWGIKVGGHLFQVGVSNSFLSTPDQMAGGNQESGVKGETRIGFNIVRQFKLGSG